MEDFNYDPEKLKISEADIKKLVQLNHPCVLAVSRKNKGPIATPVWFEFKDEVFQIGILPDSAKGRALQREGRATISIQTVVEPYKFIQVEGPVRFVPGEELAAAGDTVWTVMRRIFDRYLDQDTAARYEVTLPIMAPDYSIIQLIPENIRGEAIPVHAQAIPSWEQLEQMKSTL